MAGRRSHVSFSQARRCFDPLRAGRRAEGCGSSERCGRVPVRAGGAPYAIGYCGKRSKPDWHHRFRTEAGRERHVREFFEGRRRSGAFKAEQRAKQSNPRKLFVGAILRTSWGYDQTNIEFFQVTALIGETMVELREMMQSRKSEGWCRDACAPVPDEFIGDPIRRKVSGYDGELVRIDDVRRAYRWSGEIAHATSYA